MAKPIMLLPLRTMGIIGFANTIGREQLNYQRAYLHYTTFMTWVQYAGISRVDFHRDCDVQKLMQVSLAVTSW